MYIRKVLIEQVITLFTESPKHRDDKYATLNYIVNKYYIEHYGVNIETDYKLLSDVDRAFRLVQQDIPSLRGKEWEKRQKQGGRAVSGDYEMSAEIKKTSKQMKLFNND